MPGPGATSFSSRDVLNSPCPQRALGGAREFSTAPRQPKEIKKNPQRPGNPGESWGHGPWEGLWEVPAAGAVTMAQPGRCLPRASGATSRSHSRARVPRVPFPSGLWVGLAWDG